MTGAEELSAAFAEVCAMRGSLKERLQAYADKMRQLKIPFADANDELIARLKAGEVGSLAPSVGDEMPGFVLPNQDGRLVSLAELLEGGPLIVSLNRGHWCPFCRIVIKDLVAMHDAVKAQGAGIVSIMPETQRYTRPLSEAERQLTILSDIDNAYALNLGLVFWVGKRIEGLMRDFEIHLDTFQGNGGWLLPVPAVFIVSQDGRVLARFVDADFRTRAEPDDILAALAKITSR